MTIILCPMISCVDNTYDLSKDIDLTISVGGDELTIPIGGTEQISLAKMLDFGDDEIISLNEETGDYHLKIGGTAIDPTDVTIDPISINTPKMGKYEYRFPTIPFIPGTGLDEISLPLPSAEIGSYNINKKDGIPEEIKSIDNIILADFSINVKIKVSDFAGEAINFDCKLLQLHLDFPSYFISNNLKPVEGEEFKRYSLTNVTIGKDGYDVKVNIEGVDFSLMPEGEGFNNGAIIINGGLKASGEFSVNTSDLFAQAEIAISLEPSFTAMNIKSVTGKISPVIEIPEQEFAIDSIPEFLDSEDVSLDIYNPSINLKVTNSMPIAVKSYGTMTAIKSSWAESKTIEIPEFVIEAAIDGKQKITDILFSRLGDGASIGGVNVTVPGLADLLKQIPDTISMKINSVVKDDVSCKINLNEKYAISMENKVDFPLAFGENLKIIYNDTIDGWHNDIEDFDMKVINITADVYNSTPLSIELVAKAISFEKDADGNAIVIPDSEISVEFENNKVIDAGTVDNPTKIPIKIVLKEHKAGAISNKLDGIVLVINGGTSKSIVGVALNKEQYIQLKDLSIKIPGGITADLN